MLAIRTVARAGLYRAGEAELLLHGRGTPQDGTVPGIMCFHGRDASIEQSQPGSVLARAQETLARQGYLVYAIDAGGLHPWGDADAMTSCDLAYTRLTTPVSAGGLGARAGTIGLWGVSHGGCGGFNWLKRNPAKVEAFMAYEPVTNLDFFEANATYKAEIDADYGGNYAANSVGHKILPDAASFRGHHIGIWHGTADGLVPIQQSRDFVAAVNDPLCTLVEVNGGTHGLTPNTVTDVEVANWWADAMPLIA